MRDSRWQEEMSTIEVKDILKQLADAGILYLVITGGEPFLRADIIDILAYAVKLKFCVRVFTNGLLLHENIVKSLSKPSRCLSSCRHNDRSDPFPSCEIAVPLTTTMPHPPWAMSR